MEVSGTIIEINNPTSGTSKAGKEWKKQTFAIETKEQYPRKIALQVMGDKVSAFARFTEGMDITCHINIESNKHGANWFTNVSVWKFE